MSDEDLRSVHVRDDASPELLKKAPVAPSDIAEETEPVCIRGELMGAVDVQDTDKYGGGWGLRVVVDFATECMDVVTVKDRLEVGTYALIRIDEDGGNDE